MGEAVRIPYLSSSILARFTQALAAILVLGSTARADISYLTQAKYEEARSLIAHHRYAESAVMLRTVLKEAPDLLPAALDLARALTYLGRRGEAVAVLAERSSRESPKVRATLMRRQQVMSRLFLTNATFQGYQEGVNFLIAGKYKAARERFSGALDHEPDNVEILLRLAQAQLLERDADSAVENLRTARKLNPFEPQIRLWLGRALLLRGEVPQATEELKAANQELKGGETAAVWLADALLASGQKAAAIQLLEQDSKSNPMHLQALVSLARHRLGLSPRDEESLWIVRKELQLALSRLPEYGSPTGRIENELALDLRNSDDLKKEIDAMLQKVEAGIEELKTG
jgi:thioredoxin-like negative regulator of GroEL